MEREQKINSGVYDNNFLPLDFNIHNRNRHRPLEADFFDRVVALTKKDKPKKISGLPENFDEIIPNFIYRGSWPSNLNELIKKKEISRIVTMYSSDDESEVKDLVKLKKQIKKNHIEHHIFDMKDNKAYWQAAEKALDTDKKTYIHCRGGSIRTGIVSLLTELLYRKQNNQTIDEDTVIKLINDMASHGYNYNKDEYLTLFKEILKESCDRNLL